MKIRPIRTEKDYRAAISEVEALMERDDQISADKLEVLQVLIENWEDKHYPLEESTPAQAIKFRMEQANLKPRDLVPYLGTKSRVSEILNGQRQPTVDQIRALHQHLSIPLTSLIGTTRHEPASKPSATSRAAIEKLRSLGIVKSKEEIPAFLARVGNAKPSRAMLRKTRTERTNAKTDFSALEAWCAAVLAKADKVKIGPCKGFDPEATARRIAKVSASANWAREIADELNKIGIVLIVLEHLPGTYLDGAAMLRSDGVPVIALTIRHNRIDNFWFTLMHEFAHVCLHLNSDRDIILDDLDVSSADEIEAEADAFASEALIPEKFWLENIDGRSRTDDIKRVATRAGVHRAIAAGRWQHTFGDYRRFSKMLGRGEVREMFVG